MLLGGQKRSAREDRQATLNQGNGTDPDWYPTCTSVLLRSPLNSLRVARPVE